MSLIILGGLQHQTAYANNPENSIKHDDAREGKRGKGWMKKLKELNLTEEQLTKIKEIKKARKNDKDQRKQMNTQFKALKEEMKTAFKSNKSNVEIRALHNKIIDFKDKRRNQRFEMMLQIRDILTSEQRAKFDFAYGKGKKMGK